LGLAAAVASMVSAAVFTEFMRSRAVGRMDRAYKTFVSEG
jgi:hypothetical protein